MMEFSRTRILLCVACASFAVAFRPFSPTFLPLQATILLNLGAGFALSFLLALIEVRLRTVALRTLAGGAIGLLVGAGSAQALLWGIPDAASLALWGISAEGFRPIFYLLALLLGAIVGSQKGSEVSLPSLGAMNRPSEERQTAKILDTSVIIDGRIADILETGFLDGPLIVPQFILRELQQVADSGDSLKRGRGRKGLDVLQRIKKMPGVTVLISESDFPGTREVDHKLMEMASQMGAKIVTNDFNLNKVAQLRGIPVLNINELANSLKPVLLPGESMNIFILKEGKEPNQGVAYLDDGTMVVVDNARKQIGRTVEIIVTSVLQTTAGKMFFGRYVCEAEKPLVRRPSRDRDPHDDVEATGPHALTAEEEAG